VTVTETPIGFRFMIGELLAEGCDTIGFPSCTGIPRGLRSTKGEVDGFAAPNGLLTWIGKPIGLRSTIGAAVVVAAGFPSPRSTPVSGLITESDTPIALRLMIGEFEAPAAEVTLVVVKVGIWKALPLAEVTLIVLLVNVGTTTLLLEMVGTVGNAIVGLTVTDTVTEIVLGRPVATPLEVRVVLTIELS